VLAACAGLGAAPAGAACQITKVADREVSIQNGMLVVTASVHHLDLPMAVDSGASRTMVTPDAAVLLKLPIMQGDPLTIRGVGGRTRGVQIYTSFGFGDGDPPRVLLVEPMPFQNDAHPVAGLIGADLLSGYDVELDLPARRLTLYRAQGCGGDYVPWQGAHDVLHARAGDGQSLIVPVQVDGHTLDALLDTGSTSTVVDAAAAARHLDLDAAATASERVGAARGFGIGAPEVYRHRFKELRIGTERFANVPLAVAAINLNDAGMLLGTDYFSRHRAWLSWSNGSVFVQPAQAGK
jgi:predicted aspartyl protease